MTPMATTIAGSATPRIADRRSVERALATDACQRGYWCLRLDTISGKMGAAVSRYRSMDFVDIPPCHPSPVSDAAYMELVP